MTGHSPVNDIVFGNREDADKVIYDINETMDIYGSVSVADLYDICGLINSYKDNAYGWVDISSANIAKNEHGYLLQINNPIKFK